MLLATPCSNYEKLISKHGPPRIISEIRKSEIGVYKEQNRPRLNGDLLVKCSNEHRWWPRKVSIRGGQLLIGSAQEVKSCSLRIPLRRLSLSAGPLPNSLSLIRGQNIVITMQTADETSLDTWVKAIAIELIRQTPLEDIKYFDILSIDERWKRKNTDYENDVNANFLNETPTTTTKITVNYNTHQPPDGPMCLDEVDHVTRVLKPAHSETYRRYMSAIPGVRHSCNKISPSGAGCEKLRIRSRSCNAAERDAKTVIGSAASTEKNVKVKSVVDETAVEVLLKKCQNPESYVPVKEKLLLFETLCRLGRKVRSTEDVSLKADVGTKRAKSLHDLSFNSAPVKEICRYFEKRNVPEVKSPDSSIKRDTRLINSDSSLNSFKTRSSRTLFKV